MNIQKILLKYIVGLLSSQEEGELRQWLEESPAHEAYFQKLKSRNNYSERYALYRERRKVASRKIPFYKRSWAKAAVWVLPFILAAGIGYLAYGISDNTITPGSSKASLYLDNGTFLNLDAKTAPGWICIAESQMAKTEQGIIRYPSADTLETPKPKERNLLKTPRGGEYRIELPDGTLVRLNAQSSLSYPTCFVGDKRVVELEGEGYFEIAKDSLRPFIVKANGLEIKQYGTKFSVNARSAQETTVVLEEGSIGVAPAGEETKQQMIVPGEIVKWCKPTHELVVTQSEKETEELTAWHNDRFTFDNEPLGKVMENISLWYDVDIRFQNVEIASMRFTGNIGRYADIKVLLDAIEATANLCIKVDGKQIMLMNE